MEKTSRKAALWIRVSTDHQETANQVPDLERFAAHHGLDIVQRYELNDSAWKNGGGTDYRQQMHAAKDAAYRGEFSVLIIWALDRFGRNGTEETLRHLRQFSERGCDVMSVQESWLNGSGEQRELLIGIHAWMAQQESARRSERIKAGLARRKAEGKPVGGAASQRGKDRKQRSTDGYSRAWTDERKAALAERNKQRSTSH
jgi:DNA invertase Pin-like site-specific DNA recombinase